MSPTQCRMARAALGWRVEDLAAKAKASTQTVARFEGGADVRPDTVQRFRDQFERAGLVLLDADGDGGEGVRFRKAPKSGQRKRKKGKS